MAIILSAPQLAAMRGPHKTRLYLTIAKTPTAMSCRVNGSPDVGETEIDFDGGSFPGSFLWGDIQDMLYCEVWIGVTAGGDELGRVRLRDTASGDAGVTGTFTFSANTISWVDNAHITVKLDFRLRPRFPKIDAGTETFYKEWGELAYGDQNSEPPPVVIAGTHMAFFSDGSTPDVGQLAVDLSGSYPTAQGATISTYEAYAITETGDNWGGFVTGASPTGVIDIPELGQAWYRYEITDSNGKTQVSWRFVAIHSPDPTSSYFPITDFDGFSMTGNWDEGGWKANLTLRNVDDTQFDDGALCVLWAETDYDGDDEAITLLPGSLDVLGNPTQNNKVIMTGYIRRETVDQERANGVGGVPVEITTIESVLRQHYQFSVALEVVPNSPDTWWKYEEWMTAGLAVHHFWKWHTSLLELADVIGLTDNTIGRAYAEIEDGTFYTMPDDFLRNASIRCHVTSDKGSRIHIAPEVQLLRDGERDALDTVFAIIPEDTSGLVSFTHRPENQIPFVEVSGFSFGQAFDGEGTPIVTPLCAIAPGEPPDDDGPTPATLERQTLEDQEHANNIAGRYYAWQNNEWPEVRITSPGDYLRVMETAIPVWYTMSVASTDTVMGDRLVWVDKRMLLRSVSVSFDGNVGTLRPQLVFEPEALGPDGVARACPTMPDVDPGGEPGDIPEPEAGPAIITGASAWYLPLEEAVWDERSEDDVLDIVSDPWWRNVTGSSDPADAIIIRCGPGYIARSVDAGLTWDDVTPPNPPNCMSDDPAPTSSVVSFIRRDTSYINQGTHVFLALWAVGDEYRSWVAYTDDDCATYSWVCLNAPGGTPGWGTPDSISGQMFSTNILDPITEYPAQILRVMARLDDTRFFLMTRGGDGLHCVIGEMQEDKSIVTGSVFELDTSGTISSPVMGACVTIGEDSVAMVYGTYELWATTATISGFNISFGGQTKVGDAAADIPGAAFGAIWNSPNICSLAGGVTLLAATAGVTALGNLSPYPGVYVKVVELDDTGVLDQGGWTIGGGAYFYETADIAAVDEAHAMVAMGRLTGNPLATGPNPRTIRGLVAEASGLSVTLGTDVLISNYVDGEGNEEEAYFNQGASVAMHGLEGLVVYAITARNKVIREIAVTTGTLSFSVSERTLLSAPPPGSSQVINHIIHPVSSNGYLITGAVYATSAAIWRLIGIAEIERIDGDPHFHQNTLSSVSLVPWDFVISYGFVEFVAHSSEGVGSISSVRGRDIRIGRGAGEKIYVTARNEDADKGTLFVLDLTPALVEQIDVTTVGNDSFYVETDWDDDDHLFFYGNLSTESLGLAHIAESLDGGATVSSYEDGWGGSFCGALRIMNGNVYAVRNVSGEAWLYVNGTLRSIIPFPAYVRPRGMVVGTAGTIFVAAASANSTMVLMSRSPYNSWTNLTYNHATDEGVWAIDIV